MEHLQGYNDAVTKLKVLLEDTGSNPESMKHRSSQTNKRKESLVKRWGSQEDLLHSSNQSKRELRELVSHQEDYIGQLEEELGFCRDQLNGMLAKIRQTTLSQSQESHDAIVKLKNENEVLKKSIGKYIETSCQKSTLLVLNLYGFEWVVARHRSVLSRAVPGHHPFKTKKDQKKAKILIFGTKNVVLITLNFRCQM